MRKSLLTFAVLGITTTFSLGFLGGCTDSMDGVSDDTSKRHDLSTPPLQDLGGVDLARPPADLAMGSRDMAMGAVDMAMGGRDMAMGAGDMAMGSRDMAMGTGDMAMSSRDMAMGAVDMAMTAVDMAMGAVDMVMGGSDMARSDAGHVFTCRGADAPGTAYQMVTDSLLLPATSGTRVYTYDYDGSARKKNGLKNLVTVVKLAGLDLQPSIDAAVKAGLTLQLATLTTSDLLTSTCAGLSVVPAKPTAMPPKFDGTDALERFATPAADLIGTLATGALSTKASKDLLATEDAVLAIQLNLGAMALVLPLHGLHIEGTVARMGTVVRITNGIIHGVISVDDINTRIFPAIAATVTTLINSDPMGTTAKALIPLLETTTNPVSVMKCMMPSMCCKTNPATCVILAAEVKMSLIGNVLAPDVQVFDTMGKWSPVPGGTSPNGMTLGIGFSSVTATFP